MKVIINGACGRMGSILVELVNDSSQFTLAAAVDKFTDKEGYYTSLSDFTGEADGIIDFSSHLGTEELLQYAVSRKLPLVIATTGHTQEEHLAILEAANEIPIFQSANMSVGVALLVKLAKQAAAVLPDADIEIVEKHHNRKLDAPSGTALLIADGIKEVRQNAAYVYGRYGHGKREKNEIGIHALRLGNIIGEHEVILSTDSQTVTLKHEAHTRTLFAEGALTVFEYLIKQKPGMYNMYSMLGDQ